MGSSSNSSGFNFSHLQNKQNVPAEFIWPENDVIPSQGDLIVPIIDLQGFFSGDSATRERMAAEVRVACEEVGVFQVVNHGLESGLPEAALEITNRFFGLPMDVKTKAARVPGDFQGYTAAHAERFSNLLWSETLSFRFTDVGPTPVVEDFMRSKLGQDFEEIGKLYQRYCESMKRLAQELMELMGASLGIEDEKYYRRFVADSTGIFRVNYYPPCKQPDRTLGTGPHTDPAALILLLQDGVSGLEYFTRGQWRTLRPYPGAYVINVGDVFMALSNGKYKSCLHRAVLNKDKVRKSLVFSCCPKDDKLIVPPPDLKFDEETSRKYPDFTWSDYQKFLVSRNRSEGTSLDSFAAQVSASRDGK
ncbi:PREDICTED: gibberellin 20 oxidase 5-like [Tarenaya hassleriana]|uniref:gibberellin 20 oxidase 5-like n=1 Tax=Tarenaya hassleriana TaxID=28532 RepID=UPI00053C6D4F|nr:PREDICTED: gibberellin 20 oxidase 5-like [Tarenaya hassleriana]